MSIRVSQEAAERVVAAFQKTLKDDAPPPAASMWDTLTGDRKDFLRALHRGDAAAVRRMLESLFNTPLVHGLGQIHTSHLPLLKETITHLSFHFTDTLVSLAEAVGACRVSCMGQDCAGPPPPAAPQFERALRSQRPAPRLRCELSGHWQHLRLPRRREVGHHRQPDARLCRPSPGRNSARMPSGASSRSAAATAASPSWPIAPASAATPSSISPG